MSAAHSDRLPQTLDESEHARLIRMTKLVEHIFHVPIAYMALVGSDLAIATRVGSGDEHWANLRTFPAANAFTKSRLWHAEDFAPGFICGKIRFAASAPLRAVDGLELGLLVIADVEPREDFTMKDLRTLEELASMLAGKLELSMMACQAHESTLMLAEVERRSKSILNSAPVMILYGGVDGGCSFANRAWLEFTGRSLADELGEGFADAFHPDYRESVLERYWIAFRDRKPVTIEFPMRRHDDEYRWVQAQGAPRFRDNGHYAGYIGCLIEVDHERRPPEFAKWVQSQVHAPSPVRV